MNLQKLKSYFTVLVSILVAFFILRTFFNYFSASAWLNFLSDWPVFLLSFVLFLAYFYARALSWFFLMKYLGVRLKVSKIIATWFLGESTRFIPGNIWSFASRTYLGSRNKIPKLVILKSFAWEILLMLTVATIFSLPAGLANTRLIFNQSLLTVAIVSFILVLGLILVFGKIKKLSPVFGQISFKSPLREGFLQAVLLQVLAWLLFGLGNLVLINSLNTKVDLLAALSTSILAWLLGYLSFITPSGLGIREGMMIVLLTPFLSTRPATMVAFSARGLLLLSEFINLFVISYFVKRQLLKSFLRKAVKNWDIACLIFFIILYTLTFSTLSILRHFAFASNYDLANMSQTVWNTLHGRPFVLSGTGATISRFSIHGDLLLILLSPFYLILERAVVLLVIQSVALGLGAIPVFLLAKKIFRSLKINLNLVKITSLAMVLVYLLNPAMEWTNIYDFHAVALAIPVMLVVFYAAFTKKWRLYWFFTLLALTAKEEVSLAISMLGLIIFFIFKERKVGLATVLIGILWFLVITFWIIPSFSQAGSHWAVEGLYAPAKQKVFASKTLPEFLDVLRGYFLEGVATNYYIALLKPFSFLPLLGLIWMIPALPEFMINLLSTNGQMQNLTFHYDSLITPFLMISTIFAIKYLISFLSLIKQLNRFKTTVLAGLTFVLVVVAARVNYHYSPLPTTPSCWCLSYQVTSEDQEFRKILRTIPKKAIVTSSGEIRAHLSTRENSFTLPGGLNQAEYVAILDQSRIVGDYSPKEFEVELVKKLEKDQNYQLLNHLGHFYLFKRIN